MAKIRWRESLYSRAFLFTLVGSASLLGAIAVQSWLMLNETVDRLLQERISLARTTGNYLEQIFHHDLGRFAEVAAPILVQEKSVKTPSQLRDALAPVYGSTIFREGAFILDAEGKILSGVPDEDYSFLAKALDLKSLILESLGNERPTVSPLIPLATGDRKVLVLIDPIRTREGEFLGYAGGLLHPASNNLLELFSNPRSGTQGTLDLLDRNGTVVASTRPHGIFSTTDHGSLIANSIQQKKEIHGRCHSCHLEQDRAPHLKREQEVLAFSPLPNLALGVAVRQAENEALAPAFSLQSKLVVLGIGFVFLYLFFTVLSVHSVVSPLRQLTAAVSQMEIGGLKKPMPTFGRDEVGILSRALDALRQRVLEGLEKIETKDRELEKEVLHTQQHLAALNRIAAMGSASAGIQELLQLCLDQMLQFLSYDGGAIRLVHSQQQVEVSRSYQVTSDFCGTQELQELEQGKVFVTESTRDGLRCSHFILRPSENFCLQGVMVLGEGREPIDASRTRRIESLVHQIMISAANRLLSEEQSLRHRQSREFLQRVLTAQEEERKRIARELHDTIAQELAAHRLSIERLMHQIEAQENKDVSQKMAEKLKPLEARAHGLLVTLRQMLLDLRPSVLDTMGFHPALQWYLERMQKDHGIRTELAIEGDEIKLTHDREISLFRIFQEGMQNVIRHSHAEHWFVSLIYDSGSVKMVMEDDGQGFDVALSRVHPMSQEGGLGIQGMRERAELMGGGLVLNTSPDEGTILEVRVPL